VTESRPAQPAQSAEPADSPADIAARIDAVRRDAVKGKRRLTSSVLAMEVVIFWLAIIVAIVQSHVAVPLALAVGGALAVCCIAIAAMITRPWAYRAGTVLQVLAIACGVVVHTMFFVGAIFAALWVAALRIGDSALRMADRFAASHDR
jgi:hypothetical protein